MPCRFCNRATGFAHFTDFALCDRCAKGFRVPVALPGWESPLKGLPEMRGLSQAEMVSGYLGERWTGTKNGIRLTVQWNSLEFVFECAAEVDETSEKIEEYLFSYPHLVIKWLTAWGRLSEKHGTQ